MDYRIQIRVSDSRNWWWVLKSRANGAILATSETYRTRRSALKAAGNLASLLGIEVEDHNES